MTTTGITAARPQAAAAPPADAPQLTKAEQRKIEREEAKFDEFVVVLDDQATRSVEQAFSMPMGLERRQFVAKTLIDNMVKTQAPLWKVLDGLKASGHVSERRGYQPLWIQNSIVVYGDETARTTLEHAAGVAQAYKSAMHTVDRPGSGVDQLAPLEDAVAGAGEALADLPIDVNAPVAVKHPETAGSPAKPAADDPFWNLTRLGLDAARSEGLTGKGVTVGVIDTGLDVEHPYLLQAYKGFDANTGERSDVGNWYDADPEHSPVPVDKGEHGTFVAGQIVGNYGGVQTGGSPDAKLVAARGLGEHGGTNGMLLSAFQNMVAPRIPTPGNSPGTKRVIALGPDVINNSWGSDDGNSTAYMHALRNMDAMGIVNMMAAGNDGGAGLGTIGSPASSPHIITVGAIDRNGKRADFSSQGPNPLPAENGDPFPFIVAGGTEARSTVPGGGIEGGWQGTSMATPTATNFVVWTQQAALEETGRMFDTKAVKEVLKRSVHDLGIPGPDDETGYGEPIANGHLRETVREVAKDLGLTKDAAAPTATPKVRTAK